MAKQDQLIDQGMPFLMAIGETIKELEVVNLGLFQQAEKLFLSDN